jgi:hypothetical protein
VFYTLKTPYRDGTTQVAFEPVDFIARLAAPVPKPRVNLTLYHGVLAPNHRWRVPPHKRADLMGRIAHAITISGSNTTKLRSFPFQQLNLRRKSANNIPLILLIPCKSLSLTILQGLRLLGIFTSDTPQAGWPRAFITFIGKKTEGEVAISRSPAIIGSGAIVDSDGLPCLAKNIASHGDARI